MSHGTIHRVRLKFERDFTQIPNSWVRDKRLSRDARGLLFELMSHDESFNVTIESLVGSGIERRDAIRRMVGELERFGYLHRVKRRRRSGQLVGHDWVIQDPFEGVDEAGLRPLLPVDNSPSTVSDFPTLAEPTSGQPSTVDPTPIEDKVKNKDHFPAQPHEPLGAPVDNFGSAKWADDRCPGNWRDGSHVLGEHGMCVHCHERPTVRSAS